MIIKFDSKYIKSYRKRVRGNLKLRERVAERIKIFVSNPSDQAIKDHKLTGRQKENRAFWITGDIRIIYHPISKDEVLFLDIGTHNQVY